MSLHLLRDFAEAYANYVGVGGRGAGGPEAAIELAELAATLLGEVIRECLRIIVDAKARQK